jgi:apolipoprotein N-acyltransferase
MVKKHHIIYAIVSGILLCFPWYGNFSGLILFVALIPLMFLEDDIFSGLSDKSGSVFLYSSLTFLIWNAGTTWWIVNASFAAACFAILVNTFLFSTVFWLYHLTRRISGNIVGKIALIVYWTAFEYLYLNAEISWPWLNLGNGFANSTLYIQWYAYTGALGGTVWVLILNLLLFDLIKNIMSGKRLRELSAYIVITALFFFFPIVYSVYTYHTYHEKNALCRVVVLQPNIDPYHNAAVTKKQTDDLIHLADSAGTLSTDYFIAPETAIEEYIWENNM